jgi:Mg2+/Co2+ transporter CorB
LYLSTLFFILFALLILSAFFSAAEIGMMSLNRYKLRHLVKKNNKQAIRVNQMLARPDRLLGVVLIGNTVANILASTIATLLGHRVYGELGVALSTLVLTLAILLFGEMLPKTLAAIYPQRVAFTASWFLKGLQWILAPIAQTISFFSNGILRLFGISLARVQSEELTGEELRTVVLETGGFLPVEHQSMVISLLDLEQAVVEDIMIPKSEIVGIDLNLPWPLLLEQLETAQHTRLPLYRGSIDNLLGMIHARQILNLALEDELTPEQLLRAAEPAYFIPEATLLNMQIMNFRKMKRRSAFVVDEYGDLLGLVTIEDILEEIVGEFTTDIADLSRDITPLDDGSIIVDAGLTLRHLNRVMKWNFPLIGPRTLSGLIIEYLGYIPPVESCLVLGNYRIEILKVSDNMIKNVKMLKVLKKKKHSKTESKPSRDY